MTVLNLHVSLILLILASGLIGAQEFIFGSHQVYSGLQYSQSGTMAIGDFDKDGRVDIATGSSAAEVRILLGAGDGKLITGRAPVSVISVVGDIVAGDLNRDGKLDLLVTYRTSNGITVLLGDGNGAFPQRLDQALPQSNRNALADMNGDGYLDLIYYNGRVLGVFLGSGDGTFIRRLEVVLPDALQSRPTVFDLNGDGKLDVVGNSQNGQLYSYLGNGDGSLRLAFTAAVGRTGTNAEFVAADFNGDRKVDVAVMKQDFSASIYSIVVLLGTGSGSFQTSAEYPLRQQGLSLSPYSIAVGDVSNDGVQDLVVATLPVSNSTGDSTLFRYIRVLSGKGDGTFTQADALVSRRLDLFPRQLALADLNKDGKLDIVFTTTIAEEPSRAGIGTYLNGATVKAIAAIVSAASYSGLRVSPGELVIVYGRNIGPAVAVSAQFGPDGTLPKTLGGTQILFRGVPAPLYYVSKDVAYAFVPYAFQGGAAGSYPNLRVEAVVGEEKTDYQDVVLARSAPGLFTADASGSGQAVLINLDDGTPNTASRPAKRGSLVTLYGTGEGQPVGGGKDGVPLLELPAPRPIQPVTVGVADIGAEILYAGGAGGLSAGIFQINFRVPIDAPVGAAIPLVIQVGENFSQPGVTMAIQ